MFGIDDFMGNFIVACNAADRATLGSLAIRFINQQLIVLRLKGILLLLLRVSERCDAVNFTLVVYHI